MLWESHGQGCAKHVNQRLGDAGELRLRRKTGRPCSKVDSHCLPSMRIRVSLTLLTLQIRGRVMGVLKRLAGDPKP